MPDFEFLFRAEAGPERKTFTLDTDAALGSQIQAILAELERGGVLLRGGIEDHLAVYWDGHELDPSGTPRELGIGPGLPIEVRMVRAGQAALGPEPPANRFFPRGAYASALLGFLGGALAWFGGTVLPDLGGLVATYSRLDVAVGAGIGATIGALVLGGASMRRTGVAVTGAGVGLGLGALGGVLGAAVGTLLVGPFFVQRVLAWALLGAALGGILGLHWWSKDRRRVLDGAAYGVVAGALGGALLHVPGPSEVWWAFALCLLGAAIGVGLELPSAWRSSGVVELVKRGGSEVGVLSLREWTMRPGERHTLGGTVRLTANELTLEAVPLPGRDPSPPRTLRNFDTLEVDGLEYLFRRMAPPGE